MVRTLGVYQRGLVALVWCCLMLYWLWPNDAAARRQPLVPSTPPRRNRSSEPTPLAGLRHRPRCAWCVQEAVATAPTPPLRPEPMPPPPRRPRTVDTSTPLGPHTAWDYRGWLGLGNRRANGHPHGGPWRQVHCRGCNGDFPEHHGTILHGKRVTVALLVRVLACLAEGLGMRATARGFEVAPNTGLHWRGAVADQLQTFSRYGLGDVHVRQVPLDEWDAVRRAVKDGARSEDEAIQRLARSPQWGWVAIDPVTKLRLVLHHSEFDG